MDIQIVGIPSYAGALYEGTEQAPKAIREAGLIQKLRHNGFSVRDIGDILQKSSLPRHNIGPIRNWPAPRLVWEEIDQRAEEIFTKDAFTIILGGDCSIEVGTFHAFQKIHGLESHLLVLDGHVDTMKPNGETCIGAAGMGLWFLLNDEKVWWKENPVAPERISIVGPQQYNEDVARLNVLPNSKLVEDTYLSLIQDHLTSVDSDSILVHLDVDILHKSIMPAAYAPSEIGLDLERAISILELILADPRVKAIEVTEFSSNKDVDGQCAKLIVDLLCLITKRNR